MRRMMVMLSVAALMVALTAGTALATGGLEIRYGTNAGDALYGTPNEDAIDGLGGADLIYGYGGGDLLIGGNESGWGDKILGGVGRDTLDGQRGDDALYGGRGGDLIRGRAGNDLIVGGPGEDTLNSGPGPDEIDAQDGQKDTIICGKEAETVYYDRGLDVLKGCLGTGRSAAEASLSTQQATKQSPAEAPENLFEHTGKVLVEHKGKELCVPERALKGHLGHGDEIVNPAGCSSAQEGRS